jgi:tetratricopeptide (TPR) repeat protein
METCLYPILNGISTPSTSFGGSRSSRRYGFYGEYLDKSAKASKDPLDRQIGQILIANRHIQEKRWSEAERKLKELYATSDFLAPVAGFKLASLYLKQKNYKEALAVIDDIAQRWPESNWPRFLAKVRSEVVGATEKMQGNVPQANPAVPQQPLPSLAPAARTGVTNPAAAAAASMPNPGQGPAEGVGMLAWWAIAGVSGAACSASIFVVRGVLSRYRRRHGQSQ